MTRNLMLFDKRLKSHHDSNSLINKYISGKKADKETFEAMLRETPDERRKQFMCIHHIVIKYALFVILTENK